MSRRSGLHPFSERIAFLVGGGAVVLCLVWLIWARQRAPDPATLAAKVQVTFAPVDAARPLTTGARIPAQTPLVVRARNGLPRPVHALAFALDATGTVHWYVPARGTGASEAVPADKGERELPAADRRLPAGPARLVTVRAVEPIDAGAVQAQVDAWWTTTGDLARGTPLGLPGIEHSIWVEIVEH